jgi:hypothetical protein
MSAGAQGNGERLEPFVSELPRTEWGGAMYWLEMQSIIGWEKMMLVFGYASNAPVCERLAALAGIDAPDRKFRCTAAN